MRIADIKGHLRTQPFQPFRVFVSDGSAYDVAHPELMLLARTQVVIALDLGDDDLPDRLVYCDPVHITRIEPLNGKKRKRSSKRSK